MIRDIPTETQVIEFKQYHGTEAVTITDASGRVETILAAKQPRGIRRAASCKMQVGTDAEVTTAKVAEEAKLAPATPAPLKERP